jgi:class 3 adenylate cyclase
MKNEDASALLDFSSLRALKKMPVDVFDGVYVGEVKEEALVLCIDIRNFSDFLCSHDESTVFKMVKEFSSNFLSCVNQFGFNCSYYKLLGDGALVVWDAASPEHVKEALLVFYEFLNFLNESLFLSAPILSLAGALVMEKVFKYEISAEASGLKYRDYVGYGINLACRLQTLAEKDQLILNKKLALTGALSFTVSSASRLRHHLEQLKGLQEEDKINIYMYN